MKRNVISVFLTLILIFALPVRASAASDLPMVVDNADLLDPAEEAAIESMAQELRGEYEFDIVILTVDSLNGKSAKNYADDYYDSNGYGYDAAGSGILFLIAMEEREWYISTCGEAIYTFTDVGVQTLGEAAFSYLQNDNYATVFTAYLEFLPEYFHAYDSGAAVDGHADYSGSYHRGEQESLVYYENENSPNILLSLGIGAVVAAVVILIMRASMNTKRNQHGASEYLKAGSFHLRTHQDLFLYSNVSKVRRQQNHTSGGSSVHRSSGGRSHGGGGGRF